LAFKRSRFHHSLLALVVLFPASVCAGALDAAIDTQVKTEEAASASQSRIDAIADDTEKMLAAYREAIRETEQLQRHSAKLEKLIESQRRELDSLSQQAGTAVLTERQVNPLLDRMAEALAAFIALDIPFLPEERTTRLENLKAVMDRADVSLAEKYRRTLEAYQVEMDYGRTIEAYRGELDQNGGTRTVDFLRIGRTALFYQTLDGRESGMWDAKKRSWLTLGDEFRRWITQGLRIARKEVAPNLLVLPLPGPELIK
jgi:septal ring factor EnvC (AmiA/AmiB activator)